MQEQHLLFTNLQFLIGRIELGQQRLVGPRARGGGHQVSVLAAQRFTQVVQIPLQLPVLRFHLMPLRRKGKQQ